MDGIDVRATPNGSFWESYPRAVMSVVCSKNDRKLFMLFKKLHGRLNGVLEKELHLRIMCTEYLVCYTR